MYVHTRAPHPPTESLGGCGARVHNFTGAVRTLLGQSANFFLTGDYEVIVSLSCYAIFPKGLSSTLGLGWASNGEILLVGGGGRAKTKDMLTGPTSHFSYKKGTRLPTREKQIWHASGAVLSEFPQVR